MPTPPTSILVIEDEDDIRETLCDFFVEEGFTVAQAMNGKEALKWLDLPQSKADLILLDLMMPIMNGKEFLALREKNKNLRKIPVIIMSADNQTQEKAHALDVDLFIKKPIEIEKLISLVKQVSDHG
jgi:two-component system OmpR family response regulator